MNEEQQEIKAEQKKINLEFGRSEQSAAIVLAALDCNCQPYEDVFTFANWKKLGFFVRKGEKAKVATPRYITKKTTKKDGTEKSYTYQKMSHLFCRCQVEQKATQQS